MEDHALLLTREAVGAVEADCACESDGVLAFRTGWKEIPGMTDAC